MRRGVAFALAAVLGLSPCLAACSGGSGGSGGGNGGAPAAQPKQPEPAVDAIKIEDIELNMGSTVMDGYRTVGFSYTNNSDYTIVNVKLDRSFKDGATLAQVEAVFGDSFEYAFDEGATDADLADETLSGTSGWYEIGPGETSEPTRCGCAGYYVEDQGLVDLTEPDILTIQFLCNDKIYTEYYDYRGETYTLSDEVVDAIEWPDEEKVGGLPRPEGKHTYVWSESDDSITVRAISVSQEEFDSYVERLVEEGYSIEPKANTGYYSDIESPDEAYEIDISYSDYDGELSLKVEFVGE